MARLVITVEGKNAEQALAQIRRQAELLGGSAKRLDGQLDRTSGAIRKVETVSRRAAIALGLAAGAAGAFVLKLGKDAFNTSREFENLEKVLRPDSMRFLREEATRLGLEFRSTADAFKLMEAAAVGTALEGAGVRDVFSAVSETAVVLGLKADATKGALQALQQMMSKGFVSAEELRQQLGDRLPGALAAASRAMGVSTRELFKMVENGELLTEEFLPKFAAELRRTYGSALPTATKSSESAINRLQNSFTFLKKEVGDELKPAIDNLLGALAAVAGNKEFIAFFKASAEAVGTFLLGLIAVTRFMTEQLADAMRRQAKAFFAMFNALESLPGPIKKAMPFFKGMRDGAFAMTGVFADFANGLDDVADGMELVINPSREWADALGGGGGGGGSDLAGRLKTVTERIKELEAAMKGVADRISEEGKKAREAWDLEDWIEGQDQAFEDFVLRTIEGKFIDSVKKAAETMAGSFEDAWERIENAGRGAARDIHDDFRPNFNTQDTDDWLFSSFEKSGAGGPPLDMQPWEEAGEQIKVILATSIADALTGDAGVNYEQLGAALGAVIGNAIAPGIGGAIGSAMGALFGGFFDGMGNDNRDMRSLGQKMTDLANGVDALFAEVNPLYAEVGNLFDRLNLLQKEAFDIGLSFETVLDAAKVKLEDLRDSILGIQVEDFANRLMAALHFNAGLGLADLTPEGNLIKGGTGGGGASGQGGSGGVEFMSMAPAMDAAAASAGNLNSVLGEQSERYDVLGINLETFTSQLVQEFAGVTSALDLGSIHATADALRSAIEEMGFSAEVTAQKLREVTEAEAMRVSELENDALQRFVNLLSQVPSQQAEVARLQQQINQARFQIETAMIEMQLQALGLMTEAFEAMLDAAREFGSDVGNFRAPSLPGIPRVRGGGRRGGGRQSERQREREQLLETLERLASSTAFNDLNDQLRNLRQEFFGPGGFADEAERLGISMRRVNEAFRVQRQILMDQANRPIKDFLQSIQTSSLNPGGLAGQFGSAEDQFNRMLAAARGGDLEARRNLAGSAQTLLDLARQRFGNTGRYRELFERVTGSLEGIVGSGSFEQQSLDVQTESRDLLRIIAGVGNVLPFRQRENETAAEVRMLRQQQATLIDFERRRQEREHAESIAEAKRLREELEKQGRKPAGHSFTSIRNRL